MKVDVSLVGHIDHARRITWPENFPIPRVNEEVTLREGDTFFVRHVVYYPEGEDGAAPFVYLVIGPKPIHTGF